MNEVMRTASALEKSLISKAVRLALARNADINRNESLPPTLSLFVHSSRSNYLNAKRKMRRPSRIDD